MLEEPLPLNRHLPLIREALDTLPLTDEQRDEIAQKLLRYAIILDAQDGHTSSSGRLREDSAFFNFGPKFRAVIERFADAGLTTEDYLQAALKQPQLLSQSPDTLAANIKGVVERFANHGLTVKDYLRAALKQPQLFCQSPDTLAANIKGVVERFADAGLTTEDYLRAALKQPSLFCQSPDTLAANIKGVVERFADAGLTTEDYLRAALKQPPLFCQSPITIGRHIDIILNLNKDGILKPNTYEKNKTAIHPDARSEVIAWLMRNPRLLCMDDNNFMLRQLYAEMTDADPSPMNLTRPRRETERDLMRHLGHADPNLPVADDGYVAGQGPPTEQQAKSFVLRALAREGYIKGAKLER